MGYSGEAGFHVMAESMSARTVGWRFSVVLGNGLALVAGALACSLQACSLPGSGSGAGEAPSSSVEGRAQPERVVQRMEPARASLASGLASPAGSTSGAPSANANATGTGAPSAAAGALTAANTSRQVEAISPKHLEAELNRLEAEIGN
jgi:hypothetical protein